MPTTSPSGARVPVNTDQVDVATDMQKLAASGIRWFSAASTAARDSVTAAYNTAGYGASTANPLYCHRTDTGIVQVHTGSGWVDHGPFVPADTIHTFTGLNGFASYATARKKADGTVLFFGRFITGSTYTPRTLNTGEHTTISMLPAAYRPPSAGGPQVFVAATDIANAWWVRVNPDTGNVDLVALRNGCTIPASATVWVTGVTYPTV